MSDWIVTWDPELDWNEPDDVLAAYVETVNQAQEPVTEGLPVTLTMGGLVVAGELIPNWQWFDEVAQLPGGSDSHYFELAQALKESARATSDAQAARSAGAELTDEQRSALGVRTAYIHLKDARFLPPVEHRSPYWRGRLSEVSGWSIGMPMP